MFGGTIRKLLLKLPSPQAKLPLHTDALLGIMVYAINHLVASSSSFEFIHHCLLLARSLEAILDGGEVIW